VKTQVAIVGAGPAGLLLGHLLRQAELDVVIIERQTAEYVLGRVRAGVLEQTTTELLERLQLGTRMRAEGLVHEGVNLSDGERLIHLDLVALTGKHVTVYGQTEITRDVIDAAAARGLTIIWAAAEVALHDIESAAPYLTYQKDGAEQRVDTCFIAGCDGFYGPSRGAIPASIGHEFERTYPFGWLGILADVPPCHEEVVYANHENGFALASMRSRTRSRYYIQIPIEESLEDWPDDKFWDEFERRMGSEVGGQVTRGPAIEKSIAPLRAYVFEPMSHGRLFLAGDAAHIVPPTGAKGLNLAAADVTYLADALIGWFKSGDSAALDAYSARALSRVWKSERFSWYLTNLLHRFPDAGEFARRMQVAELDYLARSRAAQTALAENYVGLPL